MAAAADGNWWRPWSLPVASRAMSDPDTPMTDLLDDNFSVPARLGVVAEVHDGEFRLELHPRPELLHHGALRASVIAFMIDVAAGVVLDDDPDAWMLTSDMSVRMRPLPAPAFLSTRTTILRRGRRSATATVDLVTDEGEPVATGAIGFARVQRRRDGSPEAAGVAGAHGDHVRRLADSGPPAAGRGRDRRARPVPGALEMQVTPELRNPAGTLQGAMVALFAEAAAEELASARFDIACRRDRARPALPGPDRARGRPVGVHAARRRARRADTGGALDRSTDRLTTLVYARTADHSRVDPAIDCADLRGRVTTSSFANRLVDRHGPHVEAAGTSCGEASSGASGSCPLGIRLARRQPDPR